MEHEFAIKNQAVERYFLAEMPPQERDAFEEHFFTCELCAADVRATSTFLEGAKAIMKESPQRARPRRRLAAWFRPAFAYPAAATLACMAFIAYQNLTLIPALEAPRSLSSTLVLDGATRSAVPKLPQGEPLNFTLPWDGHTAGSRLWAEIDSSSKTLLSGQVAMPPPNQPLDVYFPGEIKPGHYALVLRDLQDGHPGKELERTDFDVTQ